MNDGDGELPRSLVAQDSMDSMVTSSSSGDADFQALSLDNKLQHKSWKARSLGYDELQQRFDLADPENDGDAALREWPERFAKMTLDSNAVAQEQALACMIAYLKIAPVALAVRTREAIVQPLADKCIGSARAGTRNKAQEILLLLVEADKPGPVIAELVPALKAKVPKTVSGAVSALRAILKTFGGNVVDAKQLLKALPTVFAHADKGVRAEGSLLALEIFRWFGLDVFETLVFKELKPVQVKELKDMFAENTDKPKVARFLRSQSHLAHVQEAGKDTEDSVMEDATEVIAAPAAHVVAVDIYELADPVDVLVQVAPALYDKMMSTAWKERKEAMEDLLKILGTPRYAEGSYGELAHAVAKRIADPNIIVAIVAVQCVEKMAKGMRASFAPQRSLVLPAMLEKCKERKAQMIQALRDALDAMFLCLSGLSDIVEDFVTAAKSKNPQVRQETVIWLTRCLSIAKKAPGKTDIKAITEALTKIIEDSSSEVRDVGTEALGTLMKLCGERAIKSHLEKVDPLKMSKIQEAFQKANVATVSGMGSAPASAAPSRPQSSAPVRKTATTSGISGNASSASLKKTPAVSRPASAKVGGAAATPALAQISGSASSSRSDLSVSVQFKFSEGAVESHALDYLSEADWAQLDDSAWKLRLETMDRLIDAIKARPDMDESVEPEILLRLLKKRAVWKDNNFQVIQRLFELIPLLNVKGKISTASASMVIPVLTEKLGDVKLKPSAQAALTTLAERCTLDFVLSRMYAPIKVQKSPKSTSEGIKAVQSLVNEFGLQGVAVRELIDFAKSQLAETNPAVRTACVQLFGTLRVFFGADVRAFVKDVPPAQLATIDAEFDRVAKDEKPAVTREQNFDIGHSAQSSMEELFPRVDISVQISSAIVENLGNTNWKLRKEGLDQVAAILEAANKRIRPTTGELLPALKARLGDSNKNLTIQAMELCAIVATAMGTAFEKCVRILLPGVLQNLNDNKVQVRNAAIATLTAFNEVSSLESMLSSIAAALVVDSPNLRKDLLAWLAERVDSYKPGPKKEVNQLVLPLLACMQDRSSDVRKLAQALLPFVCQWVGVDLVKEKCQDLRTAASQSLLPLIDACRDGASAGPSLESIASESAPGPVKSVPSRARPATAPAQASPSAGASGLSRASSKLTLKKKTGSASSSSASINHAAIAASTASADQAVDVAPPFLTSDSRLKEKRANDDRGMYKWTFDAPRKELVDFLRDQCEGCLSPTLVKLLFSEGHHKDRDFIEGLSLIDEYLAHPSLAQDRFGVDEEEFKQRVLANSDLVLKYITIRLFDSNTSSLFKVLDVLDHMFVIIDQSSAQLLEYEASAFLPYFLQKLGDSKEVVRNRCRAITRAMRFYPGSKLFAHLVSSLTSKNARTRAECLVEMTYLIERNGLNVCSPSKSLPLVAAQISDRDSSVRTAALNTIVQAYAVVGENVFKYLGRLSDKDRSLLDERIKRSKVVAPVGIATASPTRPQTRTSVYEEKPGLDARERQAIVQEHASTVASANNKFSLDLDKLNLPKLSGAGMQPPPAAVPLSPTSRNSAPPSGTSEYVIDYLLTQITSGDMYQSIDALKSLDKNMRTNMDQVRQQINPLVNAINLQVRLAFTSTGVATSDQSTLARLCRMLVGSLMNIVTDEQLAVAISRETLHQLLGELLMRLVHQGLNNVTETGAQLVRSLNALMLRLLENCNTNHMFSVLLDLLDASVLPLGTPTETSSIEVKYAELVMKCIWKMTKNLQPCVANNRISLPELLLDLHKFLTATPPSEWRRRALAKLPLGDMPLRTVKTVLHELVMTNGSQLLTMLQQVVSDPKRSPVWQYLVAMLEHAGMLVDSEDHVSKIAATPATPAPTAPMEVDGSAMSNSASPVRQDALSPTVSAGIPMAKALCEREAVLALDQIFGRISSKEETKQGLHDLYAFMKHQPLYQDKVNAKLATHGVNFRIYIRRGLIKIAEERGESLPEETRPAVESYGTAEPRFEPSMSPVKAPTTGDDASDYKQRLARLQQMFGQLKTGGDQENTNAVNAPVHVEPAAPTEDPSKTVNALKERLARMRSTMTSAVDQDAE